MMLSILLHPVLHFGLTHLDPKWVAHALTYGANEPGPVIQMLCNPQILCNVVSD